MTTVKITKKQAKEIAYDLNKDVLKQVFDLKMRGFSYYDISEELNLPYPHVVAEALKIATSQEFADPKKHKRRFEEARLELLFQKAHDAFVSTGSVDWYDRLLKTSERKSKLLGLDEPVEQRLTGAKGGPVQIQSLNLKGLSDEELATMKVLASKAALTEDNSRDE